MLKIFISGSSSCTVLSRAIEEVLQIAIRNESCILVGDCRGIDTLVQDYINKMSYYNCEVYFMGNSPRNLLSDKFRLCPCPGIYGKRGRDYFAIKDNCMAERCDYGIIFWDGKSKGSKNNINRLHELEKDAIVKYT